MKLLARPGSEPYCRLSCNTQLLARVEHLLKVSKSNFTPPPMVESAVVRIESRNPRPDVDYEEWDGFARLCFMRKNKTLGAIFKQRSVVDMLERKYEERREAQGIEKDQEVFREKLRGVIERFGLGDLRGNKMGTEEVLNALQAFASNGIHFK